MIQNSMRNRDSIEFPGLWEQLNNSDLKPVEFDHFKSEAGLHTFTLNVKKWIDKTNEDNSNR